MAVRLHAELGLLAVLSHRLQLGTEGTYVNLRRVMGQDTLFAFGRLAADLDAGRNRRHTVQFLYQPLNLETDVVLGRDIQVEDVVFEEGTPMSFRYGFSFWRLSYLFDILKDEREVAVGAGLQLRNANIEYAAKDGSAFRSARNVGPVPLLQFRGRGPVVGPFWMGGELAGFWAPIRYLNGGKSDVEGAIWDASLRFGLALKRGIDPFLNVRYLGGGAQGTSSDSQPFSDGFNRNWLHFLSVSLGVTVR